MRSLVRRVAVAAGTIAVVLGTGAGVAAAARAPALAWQPPGPVSFGTPAPGATSAPQLLTLKNTGGSASSALTISVTPSSGFTITADTCTGTSLGRGKSCTVTVTYTAPATPGQTSQAILKAAAPKPVAAAAMVTLAGAAAKATPAIATTPQPASVGEGAAVADQATVTGGDSPGGTVTFNLYTNANCTGPAVFTDTENLANGAATSASYTTTAADAQAGTVYWVATYNGDIHNSQVSSGCGGEPVTISACLITDTNGGATFTDLTSAVNAATAGDTLNIEGTCPAGAFIIKSLTLTGTTAGATLQGNASSPVLLIEGFAAVTINSLTLTGGNSVIGGGIYNKTGTVILNSSTITGNSAVFDSGGNDGNGGGINNTGGTVTLNDSSITGNTAAGTGGGIDNTGGTVTLNGSSSITGNTPNNCAGTAVTGCTG